MLLGLLALVACGQETEALNSPREGAARSDELVGGTTVGQLVYPETVYIGFEKGPGDFSSCTGTFVTDRHILTAYHCAFGFTADKTRLYWTRDQNVYSTTMRVAPIKQIHWDQFAPPDRLNDIAVIELRDSTSEYWRTLRRNTIKGGTQGSLAAVGYGCNNASTQTGAFVRRMGSVAAGTSYALPYLNWDIQFESRNGALTFPSLATPGGQHRNSTPTSQLLFFSNDAPVSVWYWNWNNWYSYWYTVWVTSLPASGVQTCEGDSGGPVFSGQNIVGVLSIRDGYNHGTWAERVDAHWDWLQRLGVLDVDPLATVETYRAYAPGIHDHLQGTVLGEGGSAYQNETSGFRLWRYPSPKRTMLYRCEYWPAYVQNPAWAALHHYLTTSPTCEVGFVPVAQLGYVSTTQETGTRPITRCYYHAGADHLTTTDPNECVIAGFGVEAVQGYAP